MINNLEEQTPKPNLSEVNKNINRIQQRKQSILTDQQNRLQPRIENRNTLPPQPIINRAERIMTMPQNALYHSTNLGNQGQEHFRGNFMKVDQPFQGNIHMNSITPNFQNHPPGEIRNSFVRLDQANKPEVHFGNYARGRPFG